MDSGIPPQSLVAYDNNGNQNTLTFTGSGGGEGWIYLINGRNNECAKIYKPEKITQEIHEKIIAMINNPPHDPTFVSQGHRSIAWPTEALYEDPNNKRFIGFIMPYLDKYFQKADIYYSQFDRLNKFGGNFTWKYLLTSAYNITSAIAAIHEKGHSIGDLRDTNILVSSSTLITLIDCDSFQINDKKLNKIFFTRVGTPEYLPPELLMGADFKNRDYMRYHSDLFGLGILIFKFLMNGFHPYHASGPLVDDDETVNDMILNGYFAYSGKYSGAKPPVYAPPYDIIPPTIQDLFLKCFVDGHKDIQKRPTAMEWFRVLGTEQKQMKKCSININHLYSNHLGSCPWCEIYKSAGKDPYPCPELECQKCGHINTYNEIYCQNDLFVLYGEMNCPHGHGFIPKNSIYCPIGGERL